MDRQVVERWKIRKMWKRGQKWGNVGAVLSSFTLCQANYAGSLKNTPVKLKDADHKNNYLSS